MAIPTTVLQFAQNTRNADATDRANMQAALQAAQTALAAARTAHTETTAQLAAKQKEIAAKRAEVATADTPAEGATLLAELTALLREERTLQAEMISRGDAVAESEGTAALSATALARISAKLAVSEAELVKATTENGQRNTWKTAATADPLDTLSADADTALTEELYTDATARVNDALPAKLRDMARKGVETEAARLERLKTSRDAAENLLMAELQANGGVMGMVARRRMELARAERELREWTEQARTRFDRSLSLLATVNEGDSILTATEATGVDELDESAAQDAADLRITLADADVAAHDARLDVEEATYTALADDPRVDTSTVPAVVTANETLADRNDELTDARSAYDAAADDFTAWTAEVPDPAWRKVLAYLEADITLRDLGDTDAAAVTALVSAVTTAEANLAAALDAAETHAYTVALLEDYVTLREDRVTRFGATYPARLLSAVRGDA